MSANVTRTMTWKVHWIGTSLALSLSYSADIVLDPQYTTVHWGAYKDRRKPTPIDFIQNVVEHTIPIVHTNAAVLLKNTFCSTSSGCTVKKDISQGYGGVPIAVTNMDHTTIGNPLPRSYKPFLLAFGSAAALPSALLNIRRDNPPFFSINTPNNPNGSLASNKPIPVDEAITIEQAMHMRALYLKQVAARSVGWCHTNDYTNLIYPFLPWEAINHNQDLKKTFCHQPPIRALLYILNHTHNNLTSSYTLPLLFSFPLYIYMQELNYYTSNALSSLAALGKNKSYEKRKAEFGINQQMSESKKEDEQRAKKTEEKNKINLEIITDTILIGCRAVVKIPYYLSQDATKELYYIKPFDLSQEEFHKQKMAETRKIDLVNTDKLFKMCERIVPKVLASHQQDPEREIHKSSYENMGEDILNGRLVVYPALPVSLDNLYGIASIGDDIEEACTSKWNESPNDSEDAIVELLFCFDKLSSRFSLMLGMIASNLYIVSRDFSKKVVPLLEKIQALQLVAIYFRRKVEAKLKLEKEIRRIEKRNETENNMMAGYEEELAENAQRQMFGVKREHGQIKIEERGRVQANEDNGSDTMENRDATLLQKSIREIITDIHKFLAKMKNLTSKDLRERLKLDDEDHIAELKKKHFPLREKILKLSVPDMLSLIDKSNSKKKQKYAAQAKKWNTKKENERKAENKRGQAENSITEELENLNESQDTRLRMPEDDINEEQQEDADEEDYEDINPAGALPNVGRINISNIIKSRNNQNIGNLEWEEREMLEAYGNRDIMIENLIEKLSQISPESCLYETQGRGAESHVNIAENSVRAEVKDAAANEGLDIRQEGRDPNIIGLEGNGETGIREIRRKRDLSLGQIIDSYKVINSLYLWSLPVSYILHRKIYPSVVADRVTNPAYPRINFVFPGFKSRLLWMNWYTPGSFNLNAPSSSSNNEINTRREGNRQKRNTLNNNLFTAQSSSLNNNLNQALRTSDSLMSNANENSLNFDEYAKKILRVILKSTSEGKPYSFHSEFSQYLPSLFVLIKYYELIILSSNFDLTEKVDFLIRKKNYAKRVEALNQYDPRQHSSHNDSHDLSISDRVNNLNPSMNMSGGPLESSFSSSQELFNSGTHSTRNHPNTSLSYLNEQFSSKGQLDFSQRSSLYAQHSSFYESSNEMNNKQNNIRFSQLPSYDSLNTLPQLNRLPQNQQNSFFLQNPPYPLQHKPSNLQNNPQQQIGAIPRHNDALYFSQNVPDRPSIVQGSESHMPLSQRVVERPDSHFIQMPPKQQNPLPLQSNTASFENIAQNQFFLSSQRPSLQHQQDFLSAVRPTQQQQTNIPLRQNPLNSQSGVLPTHVSLPIQQQNVQTLQNPTREVVLNPNSFIKSSLPSYTTSQSLPISSQSQQNIPYFQRTQQQPKQHPLALARYSPNMQFMTQGNPQIPSTQTILPQQQQIPSSFPDFPNRIDGVSGNRQSHVPNPPNYNLYKQHKTPSQSVHSSFNNPLPLLPFLPEYSHQPIPHAEINSGVARIKYEDVPNLQYPLSTSIPQQNHINPQMNNFLTQFSDRIPLNSQSTIMPKKEEHVNSALGNTPQEKREIKAEIKEEGRVELRNPTLNPLKRQARSITSNINGLLPIKMPKEEPAREENSHNPNIGNQGYNTGFLAQPLINNQSSAVNEPTYPHPMHFSYNSLLPPTNPNLRSSLFPHPSFPPGGEHLSINQHYYNPNVEERNNIKEENEYPPFRQGGN